jgi:hypothetical protein
MGVEKVSRTGKLDIEVDLWIEGMRTNVFPWLTRSAAINEILGCIMHAFKANDLQATRLVWQEMSRLYRLDRVQGIPQEVLGPGPKFVSAEIRKDFSNHGTQNHRRRGNQKERAAS